MSWCCGSQLTSTSSPAKADRLAMTFAWLTSTPFGSLVEPEGYCRKSTGPGVSATRAPSKSWVPSVANQGSAEGRTAYSQGDAQCRWPSSIRQSYSNCLVDSTALAWQSRAMKLSLASPASNSMGIGGLAGTAITPMRAQAKNAATISRLGG